MERAFRFALWMLQLRSAPTAETVMDRFDVSRATAFRLIGYWHDAKGEPRPDRRGGGRGSWTDEQRAKAKKRLQSHWADPAWAANVKAKRAATIQRNAMRRAA